MSKRISDNGNPSEMYCESLVPEYKVRNRAGYVVARTSDAQEALCVLARRLAALAWANEPWG